MSEALLKVEMGRRIKNLRRARGEIQKVAAVACNVPTSTYAAWERGLSTPPLTKLTLLVEHLATTFGWVVAGIELDSGPNAEGEREHLWAKLFNRMDEATKERATRQVTLLVLGMEDG